MTSRCRGPHLFLSLTCGFLLSGCAAGPRVATIPPVPEHLEGFTAEYQITWTEGDRQRKARLAAAYRPPDRLRLEILDPFGTSRAVLVTARGGGILLDPPHREFRSYPEGRDALKALTGIALEADLLAALLLGDPMLAPKMECRSGDDGMPPGRVCRSAAGSPSLWIGRDGGEWEVQSPGADVLRAEMEPRHGQGAGAPRRILLRVGRAGTPAELKLKEFEFLSPAEGLFSLQPPESFREASAEPSRPWLR